MQNIKILAIETSCDDTSVAIVDENKNILANIVQSQYDVHKKYNGIVPELASRHHLENINFIIKEAFETAKLKFNDIDCLAVTNSPGLSGSLLVGTMTAKTMAFALNKPIIPINHLKAHIWANFLKYSKDLQVFEPEFPAIVLLVSGGHTDLYLMQSFNDEDITIIGRTRDDAVGEAFDKVAKLLDLGYPGGPIIDKISAQMTQTNERIDLPKPFMSNTNDFSFSGLKTAVLYASKKMELTSKNNTISTEQKHLLASSFQKVAIEVLLRKIKKVANEYQTKTIMLSGGVAANSQLRTDLEKLALKLKIKHHFPPKQFCTDNASMVGSLAIDMLKKYGFDYFIEKNKNPEYLKILP
jgi:N6-L-threonylcarbamoyladenine synthase